MNSTGESSAYAGPDSRQFKVAVVATAYYPRSHADVIVSRWLTPRETDADWGWQGPRTRIVSLYVEQFGDKDMAREVAAAHGLPLFDSVAAALTLGGETLAVDGVILIGEHGDYPLNELGQKLYPRKELFDKIVAVFKASGRSVPVFCDKHYSWNFDWAREMFDTARDLGFLLFGGSSISYCDHEPKLHLANGSAIEAAVVVYYGPEECYSYHSIEFGQSLVERRAGGESGIRSITAWKGEAVGEQLDRDPDLRRMMEAALATASPPATGDYRENCRQDDDPPIVFRLEHADGLRVTHVRLNGHVKEWLAAVQVAGEDRPRTTQAGHGVAELHFPHFATLARVIEDTFLSGEPPVAPERPLLTTGATAALMAALAKPGEPLATPQLALPYSPKLYTAVFGV